MSNTDKHESHLDISGTSLSFRDSSGLLVNRNTTATSRKKAKTKRRRRLRSNQVEFTQKWLKSLKTPEKRTVYYDLKVKFLLLEVMPTGKKVYRYQRVFKGDRTVQTIGRTEDISLDEARERAQILSADTVKGISLKEQRLAEQAELTLGGLFEHYHTNRTDKQASTASEIRKETNRYWGPLLVNKVSSIDTEMLQEHLNSYIGHSKDSPHKGNKAITNLKAAWAYGLKSGKVKTNPAIALEGIKTDARTRVLETAAEFAAIFEAMRAYPDERIRDFYFCSLYIGSRSGQILAMRWENLNLEEGLWNIPKGKNGDPQTIRLPDAALDILRRRFRNRTLTPWVFPGGSPRWKKASFKHMTEPHKAWRLICKNAGLEDLRPHDLRRSLGSWMARSKENTATIMKVLGHKSPHATFIYQQIGIDAAKEANDKVIAKFQEWGGVAQMTSEDAS